MCLLIPTSCLAETDNSAADFGNWPSASMYIQEKINAMPTALKKRYNRLYT